MDLRFKIIAEHIQAGWDKAKGAVSDLKNKFGDLSSGGKIAFQALTRGAMSLAASVAVIATAAYRAYRAMRDSYLSNLEQMEQGNLRFFQMVQTWNRKLAFAESDKTKARIFEDVGQELQELELQKKQLLRREGMDTFAENAMEKLQAKFDDKVFGGPGEGLTRDEKDLYILEQKIRKTREFLDVVRQKDVSKFGAGDITSAGDSLMAQRAQQAADITGEAIDHAATAAAEAAAKALATFNEALAAYQKSAGEDNVKALIDATEKLKAAEAERHEAWKAQAEDKKRKEKELIEEQIANAEKIGARREQIAKLASGVNEMRRDFAYSQASESDKERYDMASLRQLGKAYTARDGMGEFAASPEQRAEMAKEAFEIKGRIAQREADAKAAKDEEASALDRARRANAGQSLGIGELFTRMYGQGISQNPELAEAKKTNKILEDIKGKLGAAP